MEEILKLQLTSTDAEWTLLLTNFIKEHDTPSATHVPDNSTIVTVLAVLVGKLADGANSCTDVTQIELLLLDSIRILLRYRAPLGSALNETLMKQLLVLCTAERGLSVKQLAVRCLINLMFDSEQNVTLFTSLEAGGLTKLAYELCSPIPTNAQNSDTLWNYRFFIVRLFYMMVSQSASLLGAALSPTEAVTMHVVRSLIICLHQCSTVSVVTETADQTGACSARFPYSEAAAKLYLETSKLLYALSVHDVLSSQQQGAPDVATDAVAAPAAGSCISSTTVPTNADATPTASASVSNDGTTSVQQLKHLLGQSILSAVTAADVHRDAGATKGVQQANVVRKASAGNQVSEVLRDYTQQCEEAALQLAMYAQADMLTLSLPDSACSPVYHSNVHTSCAGDVDVRTCSDARSSDTQGIDAQCSVGTSTGSDCKGGDQRVAVGLSCSVLRILERLLLRAEPIKRSAEQAALLTPALVVLTGLCGYSETSKQAAKQYIFPTPYVPAASTAAGGGSGDGSAAGSMVDNLVGNIKCVDLDHHAEPQPNTNSSNNNTASNANKQPSSGGHSNMHSKNKVMDPGDAPMHTCRGRLVRHMTSLDSQLKRCAAELVFLLCNEDPDEFTWRTGFGNAVALLQIKGLC